MLLQQRAPRREAQLDQDHLVGLDPVDAEELAIAAGASDGLAFGHNARAALITRGLAETGRLSAAMGGKRETLMGLSGLGDLVLTCTGDLSRNRRVGLALAQGKRLSSSHSPRVGLITYEGTAPELARFGPLFELDVIQRSYQTEEQALAAVRELNAQGVSVVLNPTGVDGPASPKSQFKKADASGAQFALVFGPDEVAQGQVAVKPLRGGGEQVLENLQDAALWAQRLRAPSA